MRKAANPAGQRISFFEHGGRRVAYATVGDGPMLLCDLGRLHHLDVFWRYAPYRRLIDGLARRFTVVRWDRPGCGLSDRGAGDFALETEVALFDRLLAELRCRDLAVLASGSSAPAMIAVAADRPGRVSRLALFGAWAHARTDAATYRSALDGLLRTRFRLAVDVLAQSTASGCDPNVIRWLASAYRQVASGEVIAQWLAETVRIDVHEQLGRVSCPTLVLHRRDDPSNDLQQARDVAAAIRDAVLLPLDGAEGIIWEGDQQVLLVALTGFLADSGERAPAPTAAGVTAREREVAELVALGLTNAGIADRLSISRRTVESHVERLRAKLGLDTRAEVAAWSSRLDR